VRVADEGVDPRKGFSGRACGWTGLFEHGDLRAGFGEVIGNGRSDDAGAHDAHAQRARSGPQRLRGTTGGDRER
jgi:hypothetical protein